MGEVDGCKANLMIRRMLVSALIDSGTRNVGLSLSNAATDYLCKKVIFQDRGALRVVPARRESAMRSRCSYFRVRRRGCEMFPLGTQFVAENWQSCVFFNTALLNAIYTICLR